MGRPSGTPDKLTDEVTKKICDLLEIAVPDKYAAEANGIAEETFRSWMRKGASGQPGLEVYAAFYAAVTRARATCVGKMHARGLSGGKGSSAALWMLERRYWREYAPHQRIEINPPDPAAGLSEEELDAEIRAQEERVAEFERVKAIVVKARKVTEE